jgi:hypothetical protein
MPSFPQFQFSGAVLTGAVGSVDSADFVFDDLQLFHSFNQFYDRHIKLESLDKFSLSLNF